MRAGLPDLRVRRVAGVGMADADALTEALPLPMLGQRHGPRVDDPALLEAPFAVGGTGLGGLCEEGLGRGLFVGGE